MEVREREIRMYETPDDRCPFSEWMDALEAANKLDYGIIMNRIDRVARGTFGDCESVGDGVSELRIHEGPGYRVYFGNLANEIVILLVGGIKRTQEADIRTAKQYWRDLNAEP